MKRMQGSTKANAFFSFNARKTKVLLTGRDKSLALAAQGSTFSKCRLNTAGTSLRQPSAFSTNVFNAAELRCDDCCVCVREKYRLLGILTQQPCPEQFASAFPKTKITVTGRLVSKIFHSRTPTCVLQSLVAA